MPRRYAPGAFRYAGRPYMQLSALSVVATLALMGSALPVPAEAIDPAQAIAEKFSEGSDPKPAQKPALTTERPDLDYELDMLSRARAEELERQSAEEMLGKEAAHQRAHA